MAFRIERAIYPALWCGFCPAVRNGSCFGARRHGSPVWLKRPWAGGFAKRAIPGQGWLFCVSINPCRACSLSSSQGELEGAKPASNRIKCRAKPCSARRAWSEASIFVPLRGMKIPALFQAVEKSQRLFRQPERDGKRRLFLKNPPCRSAPSGRKAQTLPCGMRPRPSSRPSSRCVSRRSA